MAQVSKRYVSDAPAEPPAGVADPKTRRHRVRRHRLLARVSIQSKLIMMLVLCTILATAVLGAIAFHAGRTSLREGVFIRLTELRQAQSREFNSQLKDLKNSLVIYSRASVTRDALEAFTAGFDQLSDAQISPAQNKSVVDFYTGTFIEEVEKDSGVRLDPSALLPTSNAERYLQANYTAQRTDDDTAITLDDARDGSAWSAANARYQGFFREIVKRFEFEDALLIDARGNVVYSASKDVDLGTNIIDGPYNGSKLGEAYRKAISSNAVDYAEFTDFESYQPAKMQPTAWMVAPVRRDGRAIGVLAIQFPITRVNRLMTFDKQWTDVGLRETGETFLAGPDELMRSDSRLFLEDPQRFKTEVVQAGTPSEVADMSIRLGGTTLVQPVPSDATRNAQKGESGTLISKDYLGQETLQSYAPIVIENSELHWSIVAKINTAEAFAREAKFARTMVLTTTGIIFLVCLLAVYLAQLFVRPIRRLETGARKISAGDYEVQIPIQTRDEIADLTRAFNEMSRSLTVKEDLLNEKRREKDELLRSLMPDSIAERFNQGEENIAIDHQHVSVIFADIVGLDRVQAELDSTESLALVNELIRQIDAAARDLGMERVRTVRNGYLASCGLAVPRLDNVRRTVDFALECRQILDRFNSEAGTDLSLRAGIDTGAVSSGLLGQPAVVYDLWGSAVNVAHQVKNGSSRPGIYVTDAVHENLKDTISFASAGTITIDGEEQQVWRVAERRS